MDALVEENNKTAAARRRGDTDIASRMAKLATNFAETVLPLAIRHVAKTKWIDGKVLLDIPECKESHLNCPLSDNSRHAIEEMKTRLIHETAASIPANMSSRDRRSVISVAASRASKYARTAMSFPNLAQPGVLENINAAVKEQARTVQEEQGLSDGDLEIVESTVKTGLLFTVQQINAMGWVTTRVDQNPYVFYLDNITKDSRDLCVLLHELLEQNKLGRKSLVCSLHQAEELKKWQMIP
jgi:hypothetical protein